MLLGPAEQRCVLLDIMPEGFGFVSLRRLPARFEDPPPGHGASIMTHDEAHLAGPAGAEELRNVAIGHSGAGRYQLNEGQHRLNILSPHGSRLAAVALTEIVSGPR